MRSDRHGERRENHDHLERLAKTYEVGDDGSSPFLTNTEPHKTNPFNLMILDDVPNLDAYVDSGLGFSLSLSCPLLSISLWLLIRKCGNNSSGVGGGALARPGLCSIVRQAGGCGRAPDTQCISMVLISSITQLVEWLNKYDITIEWLNIKTIVKTTTKAKVSQGRGSLPRRRCRLQQ